MTTASRSGTCVARVAFYPWIMVPLWNVYRCFLLVEFAYQQVREIVREEVKNTIIMMIHVIYRAESPQGDIMDRTIKLWYVLLKFYKSLQKHSHCDSLVKDAAHQQSLH